MSGCLAAVVNKWFPHASRYQRYLESILEVADEYHELAELAARHSTLAATHTDLQQRHEATASAAEQVR